MRRWKLTPKSRSGKAYAAKMKAMHASGGKKLMSATGEKKKLGDASLDWIADTTGSEPVLQEAEGPPIKEDGVSKETKIGVVKQFASGEAGKKQEAAIETPLGISTSSSTITKGKKLARAEKEVITVEEVEKNLGWEKLALVAESPVEAAERKEASAAEAPVEASEEKEAPAAEAPVEAAEEKEAPAVEAPVEASEKKEVPVAEAPAETAGGKVEGEAPHIPDDSSTIVKKSVFTTIVQEQKKALTARKETKGGEKEKAAERKEIAAPVAAFKERVAAPCLKGWNKIASLGAPLKTGSLKVSETVAKQFRSGKFKESVSSALKAAKQPVKTIAAIDRTITRSMKKVILSDNGGSTGKSLLDNIKAADAQITKSAKKMIDTIL